MSPKTPPKTAEIPARYQDDWIQSLDGRTALAKSVLARYQALTDDLGGLAHLSYQRRSLAKRALWIECLIEQSEAALARGEEVDLGRLTQAVNSLVGLLRALGLDRVKREIGLSEYLAGKDA